MEWVMKHGAWWIPNAEFLGAQLVYEHHDAALDLIGVVYQKRELYQAEILEKVKDPTLELPNWAERPSEAWFDTQDEAVRYVHLLLDNAAESDGVDRL